MKKISKFIGQIGDNLVIVFEIVIVLSILIQFTLHPQGLIFTFAYYVAVFALIAIIVAKVIINLKKLAKDRASFLAINILSLIVYTIVMGGMHTNYFAADRLPVIISYVALAVYMLTGLCLI